MRLIYAYTGERGDGAGEPVDADDVHVRLGGDARARGLQLRRVGRRVGVQVQEDMEVLNAACVYLVTRDRPRWALQSKKNMAISVLTGPRCDLVSNGVGDAWVLAGAGQASSSAGRMLVARLGSRRCLG